MGEVDPILEIMARESLPLYGICRAEPLPRLEDEYRRWLDLGFHASMAYLKRHLRAKYRPDNLLKGCKSLIFTGLPYYRESEPTPKGCGRIARYAWGRDYHKVLGGALRRVVRELSTAYPDHGFLQFTDTKALAERSFAAIAGVGFIGRNTLLIRRGVGSWFFLGGVATTLELPPSEAVSRQTCPTTCRRCIEACPTAALFEPYRINASKCISYLTIEHRGIVPIEYRGAMGNWIFGCDACQEVCPLNLGADETIVADFLKDYGARAPRLSEVLRLSDDSAFTRRFAGTPLMRAKRKGLIRNACIAAANDGSTSLIPDLTNLSKEPDELISHHAAWALAQLTRSSR